MRLSHPTKDEGQRPEQPQAPSAEQNAKRGDARRDSADMPDE